MVTVTSRRAEIDRRYQDQLKERAFDAIGRRCVFCGTDENIEAAHMAQTKLMRGGPGRGKKRRFQDVVNHPEAYRPMCKSCHKTFDALTGKLVDSLLGKNSGDFDKIPF